MGSVNFTSVRLSKLLAHLVIMLDAEGWEFKSSLPQIFFASGTSGPRGKNVQSFTCYSERPVLPNLLHVQNNLLLLTGGSIDVGSWFLILGKCHEQLDQDVGIWIGNGCGFLVLDILKVSRATDRDVGIWIGNGSVELGGATEERPGGGA
jgi:hypothetical protein